MTIQLLPNRIPVSVIPSFVARLPFAHLRFTTQSSFQIIKDTTTEQRAHLLANLSMFFSPHLEKLNVDGLVWYMNLTSEVFANFSPGAFDRAIDGTKNKGKASQRVEEGGQEAAAWTTYDSDNELVPAHSRGSGSTPQIDGKTLKRLQKIPSQAHIDAVFSLARKRGQRAQDIFTIWILNLIFAWPGRREQVLSTLLSPSSGGGESLIKSLWRFDVRSSALGKDVDPSTLFASQNAKSWPSLLFFAELYTQALLTMGDDEFFAAASSTTGFKNPLSLDEVVVLSRQLLNVAFTLYWTTDDARRSYSNDGVAGYSWEEVREKVTKCLIAIHAREYVVFPDGSLNILIIFSSRKSFIPPDGWLVASSALDMRTFLQAAVMEEQQLVSASEEDASAPSSSQHNRRGAGGNVRGFSARTIASLSPCLGVLNNIPFAVPFEVRVAIFRQFVGLDMQRRGVHERHGQCSFFPKHPRDCREFAT